MLPHISYARVNENERILFSHLHLKLKLEWFYRYYIIILIDLHVSLSINRGKGRLFKENRWYQTLYFPNMEQQNSLRRKIEQRGKV